MWYRKAAEQGDAMAQAALGSFYYHGAGVGKNDIQSYAWFYVSAVQGLERAKESRDLVAAGLSRSDMLQARSLAKKYRRLYVPDQ